MSCSLDYLFIDQILSSDATNMTSSFSFNNSTQQLTITPNAGNFNYSTVKHRAGFPTRNGMISVTTVGGCGSGPQLHFRFTDANNIGMVFYIDSNTSTPTIIQMVSGSFNSIASGPILSPFLTSNNYTIVVKSFENLFHGLVLNNNIVISDNSTGGNSYYNNTSSINNGIGASSSTSASQSYSNIVSQKFNNYTNFICIGDSNTSGVVGGILQLGQNWVQQLNTNYINSPMSFINCGFSGDTTYETLNGLSTRIFPKFVQGAKNIAIVYIGTNDIAGNNGHTYNLSTTISNLTSIISQLKSAGMSVWLVAYQPRTDNSSYNVLLNIQNDYFRKMSGVDIIVDLWEQFIDTTLTPSPSGNELPLSSLLQSDGLHMNYAGNTVLYNSLVSCITNFKNENNIYQSTSNIYNANKNNPYNFFIGSSNIFNVNSLGITNNGITNANQIILNEKETLTQTTSSTNSVSGNNKSTTIIATFTMSISPNSKISFTFNNSKILASSIVRASICSFTGTSGTPLIYIKSFVSGSCVVTVHNTADSGSLNGILSICIEVN